MCPGASLHHMGRKQKRPSPKDERPLYTLVPKAGLEPAQAYAH
jgi:hypothetical protein